MAFIYVLIIVALATVIWPVGRWSLARQGRAAVLGFWIALAATLVLGAILLLTQRLLLVQPVWIAGAVFGVSYSLGFCVLIMSALQIGPMSLTTTMNNLAMLCGVLYSIFWLKSAAPSTGAISGIVGVCVAMMLIGIAGLDRRAPGYSRRWLLMVAGGSAFSGISFIAQTFVGTLHAAHGALFAFVGFLTTVVILAPAALRTYRHPVRREMLGGIVMGIAGTIIMPLTMAAIDCAGADVVLPLTVATPMILVLILGHFVYRERLQRTTVIACLLGALSLALLARTG